MNKPRATSVSEVSTEALAKQETCACGETPMYGWSETPIAKGKKVGMFTPPTIEADGVRHTWGKCERREWITVAERGKET